MGHCNTEFINIYNISVVLNNTNTKRVIIVIFLLLIFLKIHNLEMN